jgi:16S rRNA processing protein RimM
MENYISVGKLSKPHGISGALVFLLDFELQDEENFPPHFFIEKKGMYTPLFIHSYSLNNDLSGYIQFEEINSRTDATPLTGKEIFLLEKDVEQYFAEEEEGYEVLIGYTVFDNETKIGTIIDIEEMPMQIMAVVKIGEEEHLIPLAEDWVVGIKEEEKIIILDLPEGLLDL